LKTNINDLQLQRPTWAEINLDSIHSNFLKIKERVAPARILAVVKSDAYGHGAAVIAKELEESGAAILGTATVSEAIQLRNAGIRGPILVLSGMVPGQLPLLEEFDFIPAVYNSEMVTVLNEYARASGHRVRAHLKVDTGMGRLGFAPDEAANVLKATGKGIDFEGVFTHFANAEIPGDPYTKQQIAKFQSFLRDHQIQAQWLHASNSAGLLNFPEAHFNLVRPGLLLYGISPVEGIEDFRPILSLKSKVIFLHWIHKGETIGYGRTFAADRDTLIATIPIGYADGLRRQLSNRLDVEVRGKLCRIAGTISMDLCTIDVTSVADRIKLFDEVTLIGPCTPATKWAELLGTVPYEITCLIGSRVPRVYLKDSRIVGVYYP
jgi:alanine racemase